MDNGNGMANSNNGRISLKRVLDEDDVEMQYKPSQEDIRLIIAASEDDLSQVKSLNESGNGDICFQDPETGMSVLMAAAGSGHIEIVRYLLDEGAPWNAVDRKYRCAGDYASMNGHQAIVDLIMDHAVMSEMILSIAETEESTDIPTNLPTLKEAAAIKAANQESTDESTPSKLNAAYLSSRLDYTKEGDRLVDTSTQLAVMMDWERPLMAMHASWITFSDVEPSQRPENIRTLNVGFGMGIVDNEIMKHAPGHHTIIEAHPQVYEKMLESGWTQRAGVTVHLGRWQDVIPRLESEIANGKLLPFDGVFFDTYAEDDHDLNQFHRHLPKIMSQHPRARYSYYNGMCPDSVFFHGVACETTRLRLERLGFKCEFKSVPVKEEVSDEKTWKNLSSRYWNFDTYFLPECSRRPNN
nr:Ankyrin [Hymenolepis microstoma]